MNAFRAGPRSFPRRVKSNLSLGVLIRVYAGLARERRRSWCLSLGCLLMHFCAIALGWIGGYTGNIKYQRNAGAAYEQQSLWTSQIPYGELSGPSLMNQLRRVAAAADDYTHLRYASDGQRHRDIRKEQNHRGSGAARGRGREAAYRRSSVRHPIEASCRITILLRGRRQLRKCLAPGAPPPLSSPRRARPRPVLSSRGPAVFLRRPPPGRWMTALIALCGGL
jgi:hypothetical protein